MQHAFKQDVTVCLIKLVKDMETLSHVCLMSDKAIERDHDCLKVESAMGGVHCDVRGAPGEVMSHPHNLSSYILSHNLAKIVFLLETSNEDKPLSGKKQNSNREKVTRGEIAQSSIRNELSNLFLKLKNSTLEKH